MAGGVRRLGDTDGRVGVIVSPSWVCEVVVLPDADGTILYVEDVHVESLARCLRVWVNWEHHNGYGAPEVAVLSLFVAGRHDDGRVVACLRDAGFDVVAVTGDGLRVVQRGVDTF